MNLAARAGRWSATHRKAATLGWLGFDAHRWHRPLVRNGSPRHRSALRRLDGIERVNHELLRSR